MDYIGGGIVLPETNPSNETPELDNNPEGLSILTYNLMMLPVDGDFNSMERAKRFPNLDFVKDYDVIIFQELVDTAPSQALLEELSKTHPYSTAVMGGASSDWDETDDLTSPLFSKLFLKGGIAIVSKHSIEAKKQHIFKNATAWDYAANKGFVHVKIKKGGTSYNVIGTHLNSSHSWNIMSPRDWLSSLTSYFQCSGDKDLPYRNVRTAQLGQIKEYTDKLPKDEMVIVAGDFNIEKGSEEYCQMLKSLEVEEPKYLGVAYTYNIQNQLLAYRARDSKSQYLDYVLVSEKHLQPLKWHNLAFNPVFDKEIYSSSGFSFYDISDHYPVGGFVGAKKTSFEQAPHDRMYDNMKFKHIKTNKFIRMQEKFGKPTSSLIADKFDPRNYSFFNVFADNTDGDYNQIVSGANIKIECSNLRYHFWKPNEMDSNRELCRNDYPKNLKLLIVDRSRKIIDKKKLEAGDLVVFSMKDTNGKEKYLSLVEKTEDVRLASDRISDNCLFKIKLNHKLKISL